MNAKSLIGLALASGAIVLAGWGTMTLAGLTTGDGLEISRSQDLDVAAAIPEPAVPQPQPVAPRGADRPLNALLFSPELLAPPAGPTVPALQAPQGGLQATARTDEAPVQARSEPSPSADPTLKNTEKRGSSEGRTASKPPRDTFRGPFTASHIDRIKRQLGLTAEQEELWRPVEAALKRIAARQKSDGGSTLLSATESQNLYLAAGPLIMSLRPDQREQARNLARSMGLETVASLL